MARNIHIVGAYGRDRRALFGTLEGPTLVVPCHRGLRGPYTGVDTVLAEIMPDAFQRWPELVDFHRSELLEAMPELSELIGPAPHTLAGDAPFVERTRWFGPLMIRVINNGLVTFLREYARRARRARSALPTLVFDGLHEADIVAQEFCALFLRRVGADLWPLVVGSTGELTPKATEALAAHADRWQAPALPGDPAQPYIAYVDSDGTSDDPRAYEEYLALDPAIRACLHDARAEILEAGNSAGAMIAAVPYHREHGSDPGGAGVAALLRAAQQCTAAGYTAMVVELARRGRALADPDGDPASYRKLVQLLIAQLITFKRLDEAEELCHELRHRYADPLVHMNTSYFIAMIYTRFAVPRDHDRAAGWQHNAIVSAAALPDDRQRLVLAGFQENGMALIEMHRGNLATALDLVQSAMARLDEHLRPDEWAVHRSQLLYNRTRLLAALGRDDEAYVAYTRLIEWDPHYTDYLSERAKISRRRGDLDSALGDYERAVRIGLPFPELLHNRGSAYAELGRADDALNDFTLVLDMEPDDVETRLSRAELRLDQGDLAGASADVDHALRVAPEDPRLLCLRGLITLEQGDAQGAISAFDAALDRDPDYPAALINRATAHYQTGDADQSVDDLTRALKISGDDPDLLLNRAIAYTAGEQIVHALADLERATELPDADLSALRSQRDACLAQQAGTR